MKDNKTDQTPGEDVSQADKDSHEHLSFESEPGSSRSKWVAWVLALLLVLWMGSGFIFPTSAPDTPAETTDRAKLVAVAYRQSTAEKVTQVFAAEGQAQPDRLTTILAETTGAVAEVLAENGDILEAGAVLARLTSSRQEAALTQAQEEVRRVERDFQNAEQLLERGAASADRVSDARATLAAARAQLSSAEDAMEDTIIRAPFTGRLDALEINEGEFMQSGSDVATIIDSDPLAVIIQVPQQALSTIHEGQKAEINFITGEKRDGKVKFVGINADTATRTFRVEVSVANKIDPLPSGLSAQVRIPTGETLAHFMSPAILSLAPDGALGVKTVDENDIVAFYPINIERAQVDGVWVSGLPDEVRIITIGQGFVNDGETVDPKVESDPSEASE